MKNIRNNVFAEAILLIATEGYDPQYGARPLKRVLQCEVLNKLSKMILADEIRKDKKIVNSFKDSPLTNSPANRY